jgi:rhodanese-related sulfurtransferase
LIDVREPSEYDAGHIPGITLIPMGEIPNRLADIPKDKTVIVSCQSGRRSSQIASFLQEQVTCLRHQ